MKKKIQSLVVLALPYLIIMLLPVLSVVCLTNMITEQHRATAVAEKQKNLEIAFERFQKRMETISNIVYAISTDLEVSSYAYSCLNDGSLNMMDHMEISRLLATYMTNNDLEVVFFYDQQHNRVVSNDTVISDAAAYFGYYYQPLRYRTDEYIEYLKKLSWGAGFGEVESAKVKGKVSEIIEYRISLPIGLTTTASQLVLVMDANGILGDLMDCLEGGSEFYIYDMHEHLIYAQGEQYKYLLDEGKEIPLSQLEEEKGVLGAVLVSDDRQWTVKLFLPEFSEFDSVWLDSYYWIWVILPVVFSVILCISFTMRNHREIKDLISMFQGRGEAGTAEEDEIGYRSVRKYADKLIRENLQYRENANGYEKSLKYEILDKLVRKTYENREEILEALGKGTLSVVGEHYAVLCIYYDSNYYPLERSDKVSEKDFVSSVINEMVKEQFRGTFELFDTADREIICILALDVQEDADTQLREMISGLFVELSYHCGLPVNIAAGNVVESILDVGDSYQNARKVISYQQSMGSKIYLYSELIQMENVYYYPKELDDKLYNYLIVGNAEEASEILKTIYAANFESGEPGVTVTAAQMIRTRIQDCIISAFRKSGILSETDRNQLYEIQNIDRFFEVAFKLVKKMSDDIRKKKKTSQEQSAEKIIEYLREHYCDNELSLKQISCELGFHEKYISNLFKSIYDENLYAVIENMRMEKAKELLKNTSLKISEVAEKTGYTSDASFRRAFKKTVGISPVEFREI